MLEAIKTLLFSFKDNYYSRNISYRQDFQLLLTWRIIGTASIKWI